MRSHLKIWGKSLLHSSKWSLNSKMADRSRLVKTLVNGQQKAGSYTIEWDSKDTNGELLPSGIYFVELKVDDKFTQAKKLLLLR